MKFCERCGAQLPQLNAPQCPACGTRFEPPPPPPPATGWRARFNAGRPGGWGGIVAWVRGGVLLNWQGTLIGIVAAWFGLPLIVLLAGIGGVTGGIVGFVSGSILGDAAVERLEIFYAWILPLPIEVHELIPTWAWQIGGPIGAITGAVYGAWTLAWMGAVYPWEALYAGDPSWPVSIAVGQVVSALVIGAAYTLAMIAFERRRLCAGGKIRPPSPREVAALAPIITDCAARLGVPGTAPHLLMEDTDAPRAAAGARHLVVSVGLLAACRDDRPRLAAALCHEMGHWRDGHAVAAIWNRGVALPLYVIYEIAARMLMSTTNTRARPLTFALRVLLWPFIVTTKWIVAPAQARYWKACEYAADAATAQAGHGEALRKAIREHGEPAEGIAAWDQAIAARPPAELRLARLEAPGRNYDLWADLPDPATPEGERP